MKDQTTISLNTASLAIGYEKLVVLNDLNLQLKKGELVCLMGQNGTGKSTLLRTISGVQRPLLGDVKIGGTLLHEMKIPDVARKISLVLTEKPTSGNLSVFELVSMGRYPYLGWNVKLSISDKHIIESALEEINLVDLQDKKLYTLSDGQLQKVMIARALVQEGEIMILDEPTSHLDLNNRVEIMCLLRKLAKDRNKSILMATHELDLALQMADKLWLVNRNKTIAAKVPEDLVLNGSMDAVFGHKGFDLKTGRVAHEKTGKIIKLIGVGHGYWWTKNALERKGYTVNDDGIIGVEVLEDKGKFSWTILKNGEDESTNTIENLLNAIGIIFQESLPIRA
ncbi:MAG: ABC transporter ATP-binding protein [Cyclobacteriaceae bacterium]|nr:ABC transporter ATP-binding protein [Cyclobacteriaceae bacterium]